MQGVCVEVHGLANKTVYNGRRGTIMFSKNRNTHRVQIDGCADPIDVKTRNLCSVFCLGLPKEYRMCVYADAMAPALVRAVDNVDNSKYYVFFLGTRTGDQAPAQHFVRVRLPIFTMAMTQISELDREPLMRIYLQSASQDDRDVKIVFGDSMQVSDEAPACVDIDSSYAEYLSMLEFSSVTGDAREENIRREIERHTAQIESTASM